MKLPISVKAVLLDGGKVLLLRNDRDEWELPGGRLEPGETPEECAEREVREETGLDVVMGSPVRAWVYEVIPGKQVFIVAYGCRAESVEGSRTSHEHTGMQFVGTGKLRDIAIPEGYVKAIQKWEEVLGAGATSGSKS